MPDRLPSEVPFSFNPLNYLVKPRIQDVGVSLPPPELTHNQQQAIRWVWSWNPYIDAVEKPLQGPAEALDYARSHREHLAALQEAGLAIPKHQHFVAKHPVNSNLLALYMKVEYVPFKGISEVWYPKVARHIGESLLRYIDWVEATRQPHFLGEIGELSQYSLNPHNPDDTPYLIDTEPSFNNTYEEDGEDTTRFLLFWRQADRLSASK